MLLTLALLTVAASPIDQAATALADFRPEDAVRLLQEAKSGGPYTHTEHVRLYEQLGIAYAYLERPEEAVSAFVTMLSLDRTRAISYTLSPKVTFLFEQARNKAAERPEPSVDLSWPRGLGVKDSVPVDVEVLEDPEGFLKKGSLYYRKKGQDSFQHLTLTLPRPGQALERVELPALAPDAAQSAVLQLYLVAQDDHDNEVLLFGSAQRPREVPLSYDPPEPWYGKWWVWAAAGAVVAASAGTAVFAVTRDPPATIDGTFRVAR